MGFDFQLIGYEGAPIAEERLARAVREEVGADTFYRHARAPLGRADFHCIAVYEGLGGSTKGLSVSLPSHETLPVDAPLSAVVQAAWKVARQAFKELPTKHAEAREEDSELSRVARLARTLSLAGAKVLWVSQGDHACVGGFALFERGELVSPASATEIFVDGAGYVDVPRAKWLAASGAGLAPLDAYVAAFPDNGAPPLRSATDPSEEIPFDPAAFEVSLE